MAILDLTDVISFVIEARIIKFQLDLHLIWFWLSLVWFSLSFDVQCLPGKLLNFGQHFARTSEWQTNTVTATPTH